MSDLSAGAFEVAVTAAVLGRGIDAALLATVADQRGDDLRDAVTELIRRQVLEEPTPGRYRFVHDKLREITYEQGSPEKRRALHRRAGLSMEEKGGAPDLFPVMARHFRAAGDPGKAYRYYRLAGQQAWAAGAFHDAREHLVRALELSPRSESAAASTADRLTEAQTRHWLGEARFRLGEVEEAIACYEEALVWLGEPPLPRSRLGWTTRLAREGVRQLVHRWVPERVYRIRDEQQRAVAAEAAAVAGRLSWAFVFRYRMVETLVSTVTSANLSDRACALGPQASSHAALGSFLGYLGLPRVASRYFAHARRSGEASGERVAQLREAQSECIYYLNQGDWGALRTLAIPLLEHRRREGVTHETEALVQAVSTAEMLTGQLDAAQARARALAESATRLGHELQTSWGMLTVAASAFRRGEFREATELLAAVERSSSQRRDVVSRLECLALMAAAARRGGESARGLTLAEEAYATAFEHGSGGFFGYTFHWLLPEVFAEEAAAAPPSSPTRVRLLAQFQRGRKSADRFAGMCRIARPFALLHQGRAHALAGRPTPASVAFRESADLAAELEMPFEEAQARLQLADSSALDAAARQAARDRARALLAQLGHV
jgi:tetratricopeptide (TPR) repeat protein